MKDKVLLPLTQPQKNIWLTQCIYDGDPMFNIGGMVNIPGMIDVDRLKQSILLFVNRHDSFRIRLVNEDDIKQYFTDARPEPVELIDFSCDEFPEITAEKWGNIQMANSFNMIDQPLYKFFIYKISNDKYGYLVKCHHIIADGWSMQILTNEIAEIYNEQPNNKQGKNKALFTYKDYISTEKNYLTSTDFNRHQSFWKSYLSNFDFSEINIKSDTVGKRKTFFFTEQKSRIVKQFCAAHGISLNTYAITLYIIFKYKIWGYKDICVGIPTLGRFGKKERSVFGMFVRTIPLIFHINNDESIIDMMKIVSGNIRRGYRNQKYPYRYMVKDVGLEKSALYSDCVNYYGTSMSMNIGGITVRNQELYNGHQEYEIQLIIREWVDDEKIQVDIDYKIADYTEKDIECMFNCFCTITDTILSDPDIPIKQICLQSKREQKETVFKYNNTFYREEKDYETVIDMFLKQVQQNPDAIAIHDSDNILTYKQLDTASENLSQKLINIGVSKNVFVALYTSHSIETIIGILGILKAGGAYLPIDPKYPVDWINHIIKDSGVSIILYNLSLPYDLAFSGIKISLHDTCNDSQQTGNEIITDLCEIPAYAIYTSGSTGKPKGVVVCHEALRNYIHWAEKQYSNHDKPIMPLYSSLSFDLTVTSIFLPLVVGGTIVIYRENEKTNNNVLYDILQENICTIVKLTPAHLALISKLGDNYDSHIKTLIVGGEQLYSDLALSVWNKFGQDVSIYNEYGPTEATVGCMIYKFNPEVDVKGVVPIGKPIHGMKIYVLDHDLNPVPVFMEGEIYISGRGLAKGYVNAPELTSKHFITHPSFGRLYQTGDKAKFISDNCIQYIGRTDQQAKINGFRVSLSEIENCIINHPQIDQAIALITKFKDGNETLALYYASQIDISETELKVYISQKLPYYMIPSIIIRLDYFPLTVNGKIDKKGLLLQGVNKNMKKTIIIQKEKISILLKTVSNILDDKTICSNDHFFRLGGDSIKAILLSSQLKKIGYNLSVKDILFHPVFSEMINYIKPLECSYSSNHIHEGIIERTPIVDWFFNNKIECPDSYCQSLCLHMNLTFTIEELQKIFSYLIQYHDALRISIDDQKRMYYNNHCLKEVFQIDEYRMNAKEDFAYVLKDITFNLSRKMSLQVSPTLRVCLITLPDKSQKLIIVVHHLSVDGVSWRILLEDLDQLIHQLKHEDILKLSGKMNSYQDWAAYVNNKKNKALCDEQNPLCFTKPHSSLFVKYSEQNGGSHCLNLKIYELNQNVTKLLIGAANKRYDTKPDELLTAALSLTIAKVMNVSDIIIELERHGRDMDVDLDLTRTIGWFSSLCTIPIHIVDESIGKHINNIKESIKTISFNGVQYVNTGDGKHWKAESKWVKLNYLGAFIESYDNFKIQAAEESFINNLYNDIWCPIEVNVIVATDIAKIAFRFDINIIDKETSEKIANQFIFDIEQIVCHCTDIINDLGILGSEAIGMTQDEFESIFE